MLSSNSENNITQIERIVTKIAKRRRDSLRQAREIGLDGIERAYYMAEANAYNVVIDMIAEEFGSESVWRFAEEVK